MTLLESLSALDFSGVVNAKADISLAVNGVEFKAVVDGGAAVAALGDLGKSIEDLRSGLDPEKLFAGLREALTGLAGHFDTGGLPLAGHAAAVQEGILLVSGLLEAWKKGDPFAALGGTAVSSLGKAIEKGLGGYTSVALKSADQFRQMSALAESAWPSDPAAAAARIAALLLPAPVQSMRVTLDRVFAVDAALVIPVTRVNGLTIALDDVTAALAAGNVAQLRSAVSAVAAGRARALTSLRDDLGRLGPHIADLRADGLAKSVTDAVHVIRTADEGVLEFLGTLRRYIAGARSTVAGLDPELAFKALDPILDLLEKAAKDRFERPVDEAVEQVTAFVRGTLAHLGLRELRAEIRGFFHAAVEAVDDLDLDRYATHVRGVLTPVRDLLDGDVAALTAQIRQALQGVVKTVEDAVKAIKAAVTTIKTAVEGVATQATKLLGDAADSLEAVAKQMRQMKEALENLNVEEAAQQVVDRLTQLRAKVQKLLSKAPLPEPVRPLVDQLVEQVRGLDLGEMILDKVRAAIAPLSLSNALGSTIRNGLKTVEGSLANLVPDELVRSIDRELRSATQVLGSFDPNQLVGDVGKYVDDVVKAVDAVDLSGLADSVQAPFRTVLDAVDAVKPSRLLAPVLTAWDRFAGEFASVDPTAAADRADQAIGSLGDGLRRTVMEPIARAAGEGASVAEAGAAVAEREVIKIREVVHMFGYVPRKLLAGLRSLDGQAQEAVRAALSPLAGGLVTDLRRIDATVRGLPDRLRSGMDAATAPVAAAQLRAEAALRVDVGGAAVSADVDVSVVFDSDPAGLREEIEAELEAVCADAAATAGALAADLSTALETGASLLAAGPLAGATDALESLVKALDVEPLAEEFEAFVLECLRRMETLLPKGEEHVRRFTERGLQIVQRYNPGTQALKFLSVLDVIRDEVAVLDPRILVVDLDRVHAVIRRDVAAYDPSLLVGEAQELLAEVSRKLKGLTPSSLLGDLSFLTGVQDEIKTLSAAKMLEGVGGGLKAVGEKLSALDPTELLKGIDELPVRVLKAFEAVVEQLKQEIVALLESLRYADAEVKASVSVSVGGGT